MLLDIDTCSEGIADFLSTSNPQILGPHEIQYGYGWSPSISYWIGKRRVHLYHDMCVEIKPEPLAVEIADITDEENPFVRRSYVNSIERMQDIMERFLCKNVSVDEFSGDDWISNDLDSDKFIPDPPDGNNPANFAYWVSPSDRAEKDLKVQTSKPWWQIW
jgi:hypothetical protein